MVYMNAKMEKSALLIQRLLRGYVVAKVYQKQVHRIIIDNILKECRRKRDIIYTDSQIKIVY